jgi:Xaa-Pro aminopeptidase
VTERANDASREPRAATRDLPFAKRRERVFDALTAAAGKDAVLVVPSAPVFVRNNDVEHEYRQDSDFFYLTGFDEPHSVLVMSTRERKTTLFVRPRDREREVWDGPRAGVDGAKSDFGADQAFTIGELGEQLPKLLENTRRVYYRFGRDRAFDERMLSALDHLRARARFGIAWPTEMFDPAPTLHEMRLFKDAFEIEQMRRASAITREAHLRAMAAAKPGVYEYEIEGILLDVFRRNGSERTAYGSIVGSGPNATILHYRANNRCLEEGDLLLIDAGCEYGFLASDVTRTFPVSKRFSREQQAIYELVLEAQIASIEATRPGATLDDIHRASVEVLTRGLVRLGILSGEPAKLIEDEAYKPFYMHRTSHWLGMDVHDVGGYFIDGKPRKLEPGMVLTVEPGLYIGKDESRAPAEYRGIGVRIEDDILVAEGAPVNLTEGIPKSVDEVLRACNA